MALEFTAHNISIETRFYPSNLRDTEKDVIVQLFGNDKSRKIVILLSNNSKMYLNEIQNAVGGSKTTTVEILKQLENNHLVESKWDIKEVTNQGGPKKRAVRRFSLNEGMRALLDTYEPLLRRGL